MDPRTYIRLEVSNYCILQRDVMWSSSTLGLKGNC
jgi:hypothetical protein